MSMHRSPSSRENFYSVQGGILFRIKCAKVFIHVRCTNTFITWDFKTLTIFYNKGEEADHFSPKKNTWSATRGTEKLHQLTWESNLHEEASFLSLLTDLRGSWTLSRGNIYAHLMNQRSNLQCDSPTTSTPTTADMKRNEQKQMLATIFPECYSAIPQTQGSLMMSDVCYLYPTYCIRSRVNMIRASNLQKIR